MRRSVLYAAIAFAVVGTLFVLVYLTRHPAYPLGWDSPFYVWRTAAVGVDGLDRIGGVRPATPLLFHALRVLTGTEPFTIVAIGPAVLGAVGGLAAAGLLRSALGIGSGWIPIVAVLAWIGFGHPGMVREQPDNVLEAALAMAALAAGIAYVRGGRGWTAMALLLAGAGLAHWPFYALTLAILVAAVATYCGRQLLGGSDEHRRRARRLLGAGAVSAGIAGGAFLWRPPAAWSSPKLAELSDLLRDRFVRRAGDAHRLPVLPLAGMGIAVANRRRDEPGGRLFVHVMLAWIALTAVGAGLQVLGVPTAGLRLLNNLFPLTLLLGAMVWWLSTRLPRAAGTALVVAALAGFGTLAVPFLLQGKPWYEPAAVRQVATAGSWAERYLSPGQPVAFTLDTEGDALTEARRRNTILAALPPGVARRTIVTEEPALDRPTFSIEGYDPVGYARAATSGEEIAPGVALDGAPVEFAPIGLQAGPLADTSGTTLALVLLVGGLALFAAGLGWSLVLLPADPALRVCLAPALGAAVAVISGVVWAAAGLPLDGAAGAGPLGVSAVAGAAAALVRGRSERPGQLS